MGFDEHQINLERHQQKIANGMKYTTMEAYRLEQEKAFNGQLDDAEARGVMARIRRGLRRMLRRR
jgi:hypothetical protein